MRLVGLVTLLAASCVSCGTVEAGEDFEIAEVVFDEGYYYCVVEPMLFAQSCGSGDPDQDGMGVCHYNVTSFTLRDYRGLVGGLVGESCSGNNPRGAVIDDARANYQSAQRQMRVDPSLAPLLNRPTQKSTHPRRIFGDSSPEAGIIRDWATRYSSQ